MTVEGLSLGAHTITIEFEYVLPSNPGNPLMLASASQEIIVNAGQNTLEFADAEYDTTRFDEDGDRISNLAEFSNQSNPFVAAPSAKNIRITANTPLNAGSLLTGNYVFSDTNNDTEGASTYQWLLDDTPIIGATSPTYTLMSTDIGHTIRFKVIPIALNSGEIGMPAISSAAVNVSLIGELGGGLPRATAIKGHYAYVAASGILSIIDIADPAKPKEVGYYDILQDGADGVTINGNYAYVAESFGLLILDISSPTAPTKVAEIATSGGARAVSVVGNFAYIADRTGGLRIIDIHDPIIPSEYVVVDTPDWANDVAVSGKYIYVADSNSGLLIIDISLPLQQAIVGSYQTTDTAYGVAVSGSYAYVADGSGGLRIIDVSDASTPAEKGHIDVPSPSSYFSDVAVSGNYAYVTESGF